MESPKGVSKIAKFSMGIAIRHDVVKQNKLEKFYNFDSPSRNVFAYRNCDVFIAGIIFKVMSVVWSFADNRSKILHFQLTVLSYIETAGEVCRRSILEETYRVCSGFYPEN